MARRRVIAGLGGAMLLAAAPLSAARRPVYVALGDSITAGYGSPSGSGYAALLCARLRAVFPGLELRNLARNGATSTDVLRVQADAAGASTPVLVTVAVGVNDLTRSVPADVFARNVTAIVDRLERPGAPLVVANLPDVSLAPAVPSFLRAELGRRVGEMNDALREALAGRRAVLADVFTRSRAALPGRPELFHSDGYHPSALGQRIWAEAMWPSVADAVSRRGA